MHTFVSLGISRSGAHENHRFTTCNSQLFEKSTARKVCGDLPHTRTLPPSFALHSHTRHCPTSMHRDLEDSTNIHRYLLAAKNPRTLPTTTSSPFAISAASINSDCKAPLANPLHNSNREIVSLKTEPSSKNKTNHLAIKHFFPQNSHPEMNWFGFAKVQTILPQHFLHVYAPYVPGLPLIFLNFSILVRTTALSVTLPRSSSLDGK